MADDRKRDYISSSREVWVPYSLIREVRSLISDYADTNELFEGEENSDEKIGRYIALTVDDFNGTPPIFQRGVEPGDLVIPAGATLRPIIINGAAVRVLRSVIIKLARNDQPFTAGNVTMQPNAVWRNLEPIVTNMSNEYQQQKMNLKVSANISGGWGNGGSLSGIPTGGAWRSMLTEMYNSDYRDAFLTDDGLLISY